METHDSIAIFGVGREKSPKGLSFNLIRLQDDAVEVQDDGAEVRLYATQGEVGVQSLTT